MLAPEFPNMADVSHSTRPAHPARRSTEEYLEPGPSYDPIDRPTKRRAAQACHRCRARKVRCNLINTGPPCSNCRVEGVKCVILENKRRNMAPWIKAGDGDFGLSSGMEFSSDSQVPPTLTPQEEMLLMPPPWPKHSAPLSPNFSTNNIATSVPGPWGAFQEINPPPVVLPLYSSGLPPYLSPLPPHIGPDDAAFLERKGVLNIPQDSLRNEILRHYLEFVHPSLPILDINEFLQQVDKVGPDGGMISLLLFQAVMFSGSAFVDEQLLVQAGYPSRKDARRDLFQKCKLLYDFDYETKSTSRLQSLLLMTDWYEFPNEQKNTRYWLHLAISLALKRRLNHEPGNSEMTNRQNGLSRRIWWSCCMRDSLISVAMRQPVYIKEEDYNVPMLTLDDFDISPLPNDISCIPQGWTLSWDIDHQRTLAELCIQRVKLSRFLNRILQTSYTVSRQEPFLGSEGENSGAEIVLRPKLPGTDLQQLTACHEDLQNWLLELPTGLQREIPPSNGLAQHNSVFCLHRGMLHMIFYAALSALHTPHASASGPTSSSASEAGEENLRKKESQRQVQRAAIEITKIAQDLRLRGLDQYLPTTGVTVIRPALVFHIFRLKASHAKNRQESQESFKVLMQVMNTLRSKYAAAEFTFKYLDAAIQAVLHKTNDRSAGPGGDVQTTGMIDLRPNRHNNSQPQAQGIDKIISPTVTSATYTGSLDYFALPECQNTHPGVSTSQHARNLSAETTLATSQVDDEINSGLFDFDFQSLVDREAFPELQEEEMADA